MCPGFLRKLGRAPTPHTREEAIDCFVRILTKHLLPHTQQEIADAVGVTQKTVDNRLESLVNLDRCPKLLKIAARARRHFCRILQKSTLVPHTYTRAVYCVRILT